MLRKILSLMALTAVLVGCMPGQSTAVVKGDSVVRAAEIAQPAAQQEVAAQEEVAIEQPAAAIELPGEQPVEPREQPEEAQEPPAARPNRDAAAQAPEAAEKQSERAAAQTGDQALGPDEFPAGVSPLTGLPLENKENLALSPAMVSITNFPVTARPQAGLSFSPVVFEMYIGEGMTRFLAVFHGEYPQKDEDAGIALSDDRVGPVRSGRLAYEPLRQLYNGFLVMSSASSVVLPSLGGYTNIFGSDNDDINSAMIPATRLEEIAKKNPKRLDEGALTGQMFDPAAPEGGKDGQSIWIPFNYLNQVLWRYDAASGAYHRYQDQADGTTFVKATDRLNDEPLTYENVVILFADHTAERETLIEIDLMYINRKPALVFRDGKMYEVFWTTANDDYEKTTGKVRPIRFIDAQGDPFPMKPGQTWVEIVQDHTRYNETVDSEVYFDLKTKVEQGSGNWAVHFFPPIPER
jgi:hypothetical protein